MSICRHHGHAFHQNEVLKRELSEHAPLHTSLSPARLAVPHLIFALYQVSGQRGHAAQPAFGVMGERAGLFFAAEVHETASPMGDTNGCRQTGQPHQYPPETWLMDMVCVCVLCVYAHACVHV